MWFVYCFESEVVLVGLWLFEWLGGLGMIFGLLVCEVD